MFSSVVVAETIESAGCEVVSESVSEGVDGKNVAPSEAAIDPVVAALVRALDVATQARHVDAILAITTELRERRLSANGVVDLAAARAAKGGAR